MPRSLNLAGRVANAPDEPAHIIEFNTDAWDAVLEWCRFHGIDPNRVPAGSLIVRNEAAHSITYNRIVVDEDGRKVVGLDGNLVRQLVVEQGEAGPLPLPAAVLATPTEPRLLCEHDPDANTARCTGHPGCAADEHMICCPEPDRDEP